jgi:hypothetical protein
VDKQGFFHPVSSFSVPSFSNCVARSKDLFSSSSLSMVKSPFVTTPASDGSPASLIKASYDYVESSLAHLLVRQIPAGQTTHLVIAICSQESGHHGRSRVFDGHVCLVRNQECRHLRHACAITCVPWSSQPGTGSAQPSALRGGVIAPVLISAQPTRERDQGHKLACLKPFLSLHSTSA